MNRDIGFWLLILPYLRDCPFLQYPWKVEGWVWGVDGRGCVMPKKMGGGGALSSVELDGGLGAAQESGNVGLAVILLLTIRVADPDWIRI